MKLAIFFATLRPLRETSFFKMTHYRAIHRTSQIRCLDSGSRDISMKQLSNWRPPDHWLRINTIDMHTAGEPLRVIIDGLPPIEGRNVLEKRRYFRDHYDHLRRGLMWEPRGHADMYGAVITPSADADFDVFFLHNVCYSTMCGHAIIALAKLAVETNLVTKNEIAINVPAGRILARAVVSEGVVVETSFRNVPSFLYLRHQHVEVDGVGRVRFDVAYGGAFYAFVNAEEIGLELVADN